MDLLKDSNTSNLTMRFSAAPPDAASAPMVARAYEQLKENHVLDCSSVSQGNLCIPGPAGGAIQQETATTLVLTAGRWVPATIVSLRRTSSSTAVAQVHMSFEPSPLYRDFTSAFDSLRTTGASPDLDQKGDGKTMTATFQRYEDGWHLESLQ